MVMAVPFALIAAAATMKAIGSIRQGNAQSAAQEYNAQIADYNAGIVTQQSQENARRQRVANTKALGNIRASVGASGIEMDGSPLDVIEESARTAELDALSIEQQGATQAWGYQNSASLSRMNARNARKGGYWGAASALLGGAADAFSMGAGSGGSAPTQQMLRYRGMANRAYENPDI